jgi:flagellar motor switch protein FliM
MNSQPFSLGKRETVNPQFRQLQSVHETYCRALGASLSTFLQGEIQSEVETIKSTSAGDFLKNIGAPACLIRLQLHPRAESMILHLQPTAVFHLLELLLGGKNATPPAEARELTEIEWSLLEEVIRVFVRDLGEAWHLFHDVEFRVESLENDPQMLPLPDPGLPLVQLDFLLNFGPDAGGFSIAVPQSFFDTASAAAVKESATLTTPQANLDRNAALLKEAIVELEVLLEGPTMLFGELAALTPGRVVTFEYPLRKPLRAVLNGAVRMPGHVVSSGRKRGFQIEELP